MRLFSYKNRPFHLGGFPLERLPRSDDAPELESVPPFDAVVFRHSNPAHIANAITRYAAMLDAIRDGLVKKQPASVPDDTQERARHLKSFAYYQDASQAGTCRISHDMWLADVISNDGVDELSRDLRTKQTKTLAAGIDVVMAELKDSMEAPHQNCHHHTHAIVFLYEYPRDPEVEEAGCDWIQGSQHHRASVLAAETAVVLSNYIRLLGYDARAHTGSATDIDLNRLAVAAGLATVEEENGVRRIVNPYLGSRFGIGAVTTVLDFALDKPLASPTLLDKFISHGPAWWLGYGFKSKGFARNAFNRVAYAKRRFCQGAYPFERSKRVESTTTLIDEPRIPRVPKRSDMFNRALFGDMGPHVQQASKNGNYVRKSAAAFAYRHALAAFVLLQDGPVAGTNAHQCGDEDKDRNAQNIKAALYFLGADAVGISRCPDWVYYSHNTLGEPIEPYHKNAISVIVDQGHETMDGATGDDWIACSQSMRAYLRFSLLGGIIGDQIRNLGYDARVHTVMDGEVLQPPLLLLSGLGEVSRIGEVILNPYLGPRLKSGVITTNMPLAHDKPIDFGLQNFCDNCNKCARECPSGAISVGPKVMFNGYETHKSDSQKCTQYRVTNLGGAMCGRCMKTCPWNLEGLFVEAPFRWAAIHMPWAAKLLAWLDDKFGNGNVNPAKKWWWDLGMKNNGAYEKPEEPVNERSINIKLKIEPKDQTLAVYPANLVPPPYPYPFKMDREAGIKARADLVSPKEYKERLERNETSNLAHKLRPDDKESPVLRLNVAKVEELSQDICKYELRAVDGSDLPEFEAGAHLDVVVAPEFLRQYSLCSDPGDRSAYQIAVLKEDEGRGGSALLHKIFNQDRKIFVSRPINHFPLNERASHSILMGGGIGITPMIAMAHRLYRLGKSFSLHYCCSKLENAAFLKELEEVPWFEKVTNHISDQGTRADLVKEIGKYQSGHEVYTCGPERFMNAVIETAEGLSWPESAIHREYFSIPETPDYVNTEFRIKLAQSNRELVVPEDKSIAEVLLENNVAVELKCSDGLCGVCQCGLVSGEVEHRDFVLSKAQREDTIITCQSRAQDKNGILVIDI